MDLASVNFKKAFYSISVTEVQVLLKLHVHTFCIFNKYIENIDNTIVGKKEKEMKNNHDFNMVQRITVHV